MPPKAKFTKEQIMEAALQLVRQNGGDALTARALGDKLGSSARPIFTVFQSMEEVRQGVETAARRLYDGYVAAGRGQNGTRSEPKLFQLLFMTEQVRKPDVMEVLPVIDDNYLQILASIRNCYPLNQEDSEWLYRHLWIYTHGIAVLCATGLCAFTEEEIGRMVTEVLTALLKEVRK